MKQHFKDKVIYQIWPRSFKDSNGDGIGDIQGIISKLDYLKDLGIDDVWISPLYASPNNDYGYDISDYYSINHEFGTMDDFDELLSEAKKRDIGIIMDLVANHTSDQHQWFREALKVKNSKYRNYYYFKEGKKGKYGKEPNNWIGLFGGSAWSKEEGTDNTYYLTSFTPNQCDLNWQNPDVRQDIYKIMHFWLKKGVRGFRMDVINTIAKEEGLPDYHPEKRGYQFAKEYMVSLPDSFKYIQEMHQEVLQHYPDGIFFGEGMMADMEACAKYSGRDTKQLQMMINFDMALIGTGPLGKFDFRKLYHWNVKSLKNLIFAWQKDLQINNYWIANFISNHDFPRPVSRFGNDKEYRKQSAKSLAILNFTLAGTPLIYQGEEIGMTNMMLEIEQWRDFEAFSVYKELQSMMKLPKFIAKKVIQKMTRDHARTPMQWSPENNAGFSTANPWMDVNPNYQMINVESDLDDEDSIIQFYRDLIQLRKNHDALKYGSFTPILEKHRKLIAYEREYNGERIAIVINLSSSNVQVKLPQYNKITYLFGENQHMIKNENQLLFAPYQSIIFKVEE